MILYHIADVHIGANLKHLGSMLFDIQKKHLEELYKRAESENVDFVLIAGDLFDSNNVPSKMAREVLEIFSSHKDVITVIIPGGGSQHKSEITGHDAYTSDSVYRRPDISMYFRNNNLHLLTPQDPVGKINEVAFYAGFFNIPVFSKEQAMYHIALIHGAFGKRRGEVDPSLLDNTFFDYIALGHYHSYRRFGKAAYSGAFIQFEFTRSASIDSGYLKVEINGSSLNVERVTFPDAPRFYRVEFLDESDIESFKNNIRPFDFVEIEGYSEELRNGVEELLQHNNNIRLRDDACVIKREPMWFMVKDALSDILKGMEEEEKKEIEDFVLRFLRKRVKKPELESYLRERFDL